VEVTLGNLKPHAVDMANRDCGIIDSHTACLVIPAGVGKNLKVAVKVGDQDLVEVSNCTFSYPQPEIRDVMPLFGPSTGNEVITVSGQNFGSDSQNVLVQLVKKVDQNLNLNVYQNSTNLACQINFLNDTVIKCKPKASGAYQKDLSYQVQVAAGTADHKQAQVYKGQSFTALACERTCDSESSGTCDTDGTCRCKTANYVPHASTKFVSGVPVTSCKCGLGGQIQCNHGEPDMDTCSCQCTQQWESDPEKPLMQVCDVCSKKCQGFFDNADPSISGVGSSDCKCTFNKLHLIWLLPAGLLIVALLIFICQRCLCGVIKGTDHDEENNATAPMLTPEKAEDEYSDRGSSANIII